MGSLPLWGFSFVLRIQAIRGRPRSASREKSGGALGAKVSAHVGYAGRAEIIGAAKRAVAVHAAFSGGDRARDHGYGLGGGLNPRGLRRDARSLSRLQFQRLCDPWSARPLFYPGRNPAILSILG